MAETKTKTVKLIKTSSVVLSWKEPKKFRVAWVYETTGVSEIKLYQFQDIYLHPSKFEVKGESYVLPIGHPRWNNLKSMVEIVPFAPNPSDIELIVGSLSKFETL